MTFLLIAGSVLALAFAGWRIWRRTRFFLHLLQLEGYKRNEYAAWIRRNRRGLLVRLSHRIAAGLLVAATILAFLGMPWVGAALALFAWPWVFASSRRYRREVTKKPLVFTERMKRLATATFVLATVVAVAPLAIVSTLAAPPSAPVALLLGLLGLGAADLLAPLVVALAAMGVSPVERSIQDGYKRAARERLRARPDLIVVAITGSYGKTSTKMAIATVLGHRRNVLASPGSYNTPMGLCRVINDMLQPHHQVLILEMGARYPGDIQELCDLAAPRVGVVTNVGVAHLESFGSQDAIAREKGTLVENIQVGGTAILNADDPAVASMSQRFRGGEIITVGTSDGADIRAENISYGVDGTRFDIVARDGERHAVLTEVLGLHNVMNLLFAAAVGTSLGMRMREITYALRRLPPVDHRLRLRREGDLLVLDDAFNANPVGARNAVDILGQFTTGQRFIITPGMVELGAVQEQENRAFGRHIVGKADRVLLVGARQTQPIREGLLEGGFPPDAIHVFASLSEAQQFLRTVQRSGDIVLYENDLPDHYEEAA